MNRNQFCELLFAYFLCVDSRQTQEQRNDPRNLCTYLITPTDLVEFVRNVIRIWFHSYGCITECLVFRYVVDVHSCYLADFSVGYSNQKLVCCCSSSYGFKQCQQRSCFQTFRIFSNNVDGVFGFFPCSFSGFVQVLFSRLLKTSEDSIAYGVTGLGFMNIHGWNTVQSI